MPIYSNEGGVTCPLKTIYSNEGGIKYPLNSIWENDGGVHYAVFSARQFPESLTWIPEYGARCTVTNDGLVCTAVYTLSTLLSLYFSSTKVGELVDFQAGDTIELEVIDVDSTISSCNFCLKYPSQDVSSTSSSIAVSSGTKLIAGSKLSLTVPQGYSGSFNLVVNFYITSGTVKFKIRFK